jgi:hypothetical protein
MNSTYQFFRIVSVGLLVGMSACSAQDPPAKKVAQKAEFFRQTGLVKPAEIQESSGAAASFHSPNAFWTINDSGHSASVYCLSLTGDLQATVALEGAQNRDWESMTRFTLASKHYLVVAEVGDNGSRHDRCRLYIFQEPKIENAKKPLTLKIVPIAIEFNYPDGSRDCESVAIDPATNDIWLFEKLMQLNFRRKPHVYRIPSKDWLPRLSKAVPNDPHLAPQKTGPKSDAESPNRLTAQRLGAMNHRFITGGEFSPDGNQLVLRTYTHAIYYQKRENDTWAEQFFKLQPVMLPLPIQSQGEAITFSPDSRSALVTSEGVRQPIWLLNLAAILAEAPR